MSLKDIKKLQSEKGFTIVELLIVIVVIGILAAIVIVAYNGVTQQANTSKARSNAQSVQKVLEAMNANETSAYPTTLSALRSGSSTASLPQGVTVLSPTCTCADLAAATTAAGGTGGLPATSSATAFNTIVVFRTNPNAGGVIFYRAADGSVNPIYYGDGSPSGPFARLT